MDIALSYKLFAMITLITLIILITLVTPLTLLTLLTLLYGFMGFGVKKGTDWSGSRDTPNTSMTTVPTVLQCTMCILGTMFTFQPNKLRHILKVAS